MRMGIGQTNGCLFDTVKSKFTTGALRRSMGTLARACLLVPSPVVSSARARVQQKCPCYNESTRTYANSPATPISPIAIANTRINDNTTLSFAMFLYAPIKLGQFRR